MNADPNIIHVEFAEVVSALREGGLPFLLVGGLSLLAHHVERATGDIDFACRKTDKELAASIMKRLGYAVMNANPDLYARYHKPERRVVDFIYMNHSTFAQLEESSVETDVSRVRVQVPSLNHLLAMKLFSVSQSSTRGKDLGDILSLIANNGVDVHSREFQDLCLKFADEKWLNLLRELA
ncbi:MAG: nucleotidyltransferase family protein [Lentisphaerae bacterium]|nr:nucleotidyltransferase family protein [Lentisphaerota bacterium]